MFLLYNGERDLLSWEIQYKSLIACACTCSIVPRMHPHNASSQQIVEFRSCAENNPLWDKLRHCPCPRSASDELGSTIEARLTFPPSITPIKRIDGFEF